MPRDDDDPEKWELREHTEIKHKILENYLVPWTRVLGSANGTVLYFDGFAGRGRYEEDEPGSPLIAMEVADRNEDKIENFVCGFIEKNDNNYADLMAEVGAKKEEVTDKIEVHDYNAAFADVAEELIENIEGKIVPTFIFIDPFGYKGVPFETVSQLLNLRETGVEVLLTFMVRDIRRFLEDPGHEASITEIFGTEEWREIAQDREVEDTEEELLKLYEDQLIEEAGVEYVWPFEMRLPDRRETVYNLIHATNHFKGFKIMKNVMFNAGAEDQFAYLGPEHYGYESGQQRLFETTDNMDSRVSDLAEFLFEQFEGDRLTFWEVMKKTYTETNLIEKHYRESVKLLEEDHRATIYNHPGESEGTHHGLGHDDEVEFEKEYGKLTDYGT